MNNIVMENNDHLKGNGVIEMSDFRKSTYLPKDKRKRILLLSDDL